MALFAQNAVRLLISLRVAGGKEMCQQMEVKFLGSIPLDPGVVASGDAGKVFVQENSGSPTEKAFADIVAKINFE